MTTYVARPRQVNALQIILGETSKSDILDLCPDANVGTPEGDDLDLRWIVLPDGTEVHERDYIIYANECPVVMDEQLFEFLFITPDESMIAQDRSLS